MPPEDYCSVNHYQVNVFTGDALNGNAIAMDDPKLIKRIINNFLLPPPKLGPYQQGYRLTNPRLKDTSMGQSEKIRNILHNKVWINLGMVPIHNFSTHVLFFFV